MRDILLLVSVLLGLGYTLRYPFVGVLLWEWFSIMQPHEDAFGFSRSLPLNFIIAVVTFGSWLFSKEPKKIPPHPIIVLLALFLGWATFNSFFAFDPEWSWPFWDRTWKVFFLGFVIAALATNKIRIDALIWVAAISLMYYGVKGGAFTILTGGNYKVFGPANSIIEDNNQLALALLMALPLVEYLRTNTQSKRLSWILLGAEPMIGFSVIGSYSRGAYVAMAAIALFALFKTKRKLLYLAALALILIPAFYLMPASLSDRIGTLQHTDTDVSFQARLTSWQVSYRYATDHFPFGAGFYGPQLAPIYHRYFPGLEPHAAHSIYFQVLGEQGFIGLAIYLAIVISSLVLCAKLSKRLPNSDILDQKLARMIQISLVAFFVGGAALSMAYYDLFIVLVCLLPQMQRQRAPLSAIGSRFRAKSSYVMATNEYPGGAVSDPVSGRSI